MLDDSCDGLATDLLEVGALRELFGLLVEVVPVGGRVVVSVSVLMSVGVGMLVGVLVCRSHLSAVGEKDRSEVGMNWSMQKSQFVQLFI